MDQPRDIVGRREFQRAVHGGALAVHLFLQEIGTDLVGPVLERHVGSGFEHAHDFIVGRLRVAGFQANIKARDTELAVNAQPVAEVFGVAHHRDDSDSAAFKAFYFRFLHTAYGRQNDQKNREHDNSFIHYTHRTYFQPQLISSKPRPFKDVSLDAKHVVDLRRCHIPHGPSSLAYDHLYIFAVQVPTDLAKHIGFFCVPDKAANACKRHCVDAWVRDANGRPLIFYEGERPILQLPFGNAELNARRAVRMSPTATENGPLN